MAETPDRQKGNDFVKHNAQHIIQKYAGDTYPSVKNPISMFMAGSPGAGKTELSVELISYFERQMEGIVRIDLDEIRKELPGYNGEQANAFRHPGILLQEKIHDYVLRQSKNVLMDGTFGHKKTLENVNRSLKRNRPVIILYLYQDPLMSWKYTQKRAEEDGREIPLDEFVSYFFKSKENANTVKRVYPDQVDLWLFEKDFEQNTFQVKINIDDIDNHLDLTYTPESLRKKLL